MPISRRISLDAVLADDAERLPGGRRVVQGEGGRGVDGDRGQVVGDHVVQLAGHPGAFRGHRLHPVHLREQRGLLGPQQCGVGGLAVIAHDQPGGGGRERHHADGDTDEQRLGHPPHRERHQGRGHREQPGDPRDAAGRGGRAVQHGGVHQVGVHDQRDQTALREGVRDQGGRADQQAGERRGPAQHLAARHDGERDQQRPAAVEQHDRVVAGPHAQPDAPQQQAAEQTGRRGVHVEAARAGES
jgi:hypothetical protein